MRAAADKRFQRMMKDEVVTLPISGNIYREGIDIKEPMSAGNTDNNIAWKLRNMTQSPIVLNSILDSISSSMTEGLIFRYCFCS
jgi:hypothetical protein